ncbi:MULTISPECIES: type II secretion system secretin GspD [Sphingobium]|uniref:type II secretion system secretin GspD n=1 Tax=Sphingobium TaxID=165695 RepID=UPI0015EBFC06|nr:MULTISPECIES: type II secretion system secretin GspD [Sphingobium]MCW2364431.1 general secretion pathway protein D [Sphingobium sp. B10D3B]MCW2402172.1 general secretion pathway protein D [Sphingobium sp. B10D7B]MCW2409151.1 general secretion pathway protein D [Sphingobium xanthum]
MTLLPKFRRFAGSAMIALLLAVPAVGQLTLNVRDADVRAFIQDAARVTGRTFIIDNRVQGKVSVVTDRPLSRSEYFEIFLSTLRANGLVAVPAAGGAFRIQPVEGAAGQPGQVGRAANSNQFVTEVIRLRSIDAQSALETLRPLVSRDGSITANRSGRSIVVADYADNIQRIRQVLAQVDTDGSTTQLITLKNAGAREIATSLQGLLAGEEGAPSRASIVAIDSSNSIALRGDATTVQRLAAMVRDIDARAASGTEIRVYWLQHADADKMLPVLQQLLGQAAVVSETPAATNAPSAPAGSGSAPAAPAATPASSSSGGGIGRGPAVVTRYEGANAVIVAANGDTQRMLGEVIRQLDTRRDQVLVEAIIVEIGDNAARQLGVQFLVGSTSTGFAATNYSNASPNILTLAGALAARNLSQTETVVVAPDGTRTTTTTTENSGLANQLQSAAVDSLAAARGGFGGIATELGSNGVFGAIINAVQSDTESNILSTPHITTLDNQQAKMLVGQEVPVATGEALSPNFDNKFRTVQRQNVGIMLDVTPQISSEGTIKLFIKQEVSSVAGPVSNNSSDLIINKREFETTVLVDNGDILAIGGLLDENERRTIEKIPLLGDIPLIGELFKSRSRAKAKTNLMVFIRPTILGSRADARKMTAQRYGYIRGQQMLANPDVEPSIDQLVREYLGTTPPVAEPKPGDQVVDGRIATGQEVRSQQVVRPGAVKTTDVP